MAISWMLSSAVCTCHGPKRTIRRLGAMIASVVPGTIPKHRPAARYAGANRKLKRPPVGYVSIGPPSSAARVRERERSMALAAEGRELVAFGFDRSRHVDAATARRASDPESS